MAQDVFGIAGTTQGPFTIEKAVAEGGFGVVYRAQHGAFRAPVALKCLKIGTIPEDLRQGFMERFREEAEMLFRLSATIPEVVRPLHCDIISLPSGNIVPFIALEWLEGRTLGSLIEDRTRDKRPPLSPTEVARLLTPVARALEIAHNFPSPGGPVCVVHRDIKPSNIFLADLHGTEVVKILDFGIARARDAATVMAGEITQNTTGLPLAFTPRYGAPEQWAPKRFGATGPWTDVWGLAVTFLEAIAGRAVIDGDAVAIMGTVLDEKRRPTPRTEGIAVPDALEAVFRRAFAVDPRDRYPNAGAFWDEVEAALGLAPRLSVVEGRRSSYVGPGLGKQEGRRPSQAGAPAVKEPIPPAPISKVGEEFSLDDPLEEPLASNPAPSVPLAPAQPQPQPRKALPAPGPAAMIDVDWGPDQAGARRSVPAVNNRAPDPPPSARPPRSERMPESAEPEPGVGALLGGPLALAFAGILVRVLDSVASAFFLNGQRVEFGPLRLSYLAAALIAAGVLMVAVRLFKYAAR
jgi:serine/threonine-protein kinase